MTTCDDHFSTRDPLDLVHERELAARWRKSPRTLHRWRTQGYGPPHVEIGGSVFYRIADILAFEVPRSRDEATGA